MTHLLYTHAPNVSILGAMTSWIRQALPGLIVSPHRSAPRRVWPRRLLIALGWFVAVVVQCVLIWLLREVISVAHGLMELWLELANQQLDLVSLYNSVRPA